MSKSRRKVENDVEDETLRVEKSRQESKRLLKSLERKEKKRGLGGREGSTYGQSVGGW